MAMSRDTKLFNGLALILVPTIEFGGSFLLRIVSGGFPRDEFTEFQRAVFRAGHAHAGVLLLLSLIAQVLIDEARLPSSLERPLRVGFFLAPLLMSGGFFGAASGGNTPGSLIILLYIGALVLAVSTVTLGVGLIRARA